MSNTIRLLAPAKLNLFLQVTGRRKDGMHTLQTLFQLVNYGDSLSVELDSKPGIRVFSYGYPIAPQENLVLRAAHLLAQHVGATHGASIRLYKRIPVANGLGGGSSDAASTLCALNRVWQCHLNTEALAQLGLSLGADVPVFIYGYNAWAEGVGEVIQSYTLPSRWYVVLVPPFEFSTREWFACLTAKDYSAPVTPDDYEQGRTKNVFEEIILSQANASATGVRLALDYLCQYAPAHLSGTGGAVFSAYDDYALAQAVWQKRPSHLGGFLCQSL